MPQGRVTTHIVLWEKEGGCAVLNFFLSDSERHYYVPDLLF